MSGSSFVFYRFKSQREPSRIAFDGTAISVWDLKKEIIAENRMGKGADFDFAIYNADTEEEYSNDYALIPRSTSVLARRLPPSKPGRGNAQQYMAANATETGPGLQAGRGAAPDPRGGVGANGQKGQGFSKDMYTKRFDGREDFASPSQASASTPVQIAAAAPTDEASAMAAMFAATNSQWQQTQEQMANATPIYRAPLNGQQPRTQYNRDSNNNSNNNNQAGKKTDYTHRPPPPGYICYRCGQKGHWIQECPTNGDAAYENRPRIKRTTGIPKSFLTEVAGPGPKDDGDESGMPGLVLDHKSGVMVTADGGFVVARPDNASWFAHRARTANLSASDVQNLAPTDPDLTCPICSKLLRDAVLTPCCSTSFCEDCVSNALLDNDMLCPECESRVKNLEKLKPDEGRRERAKKYVEEMVEASKEAAELEKAEREKEEERKKKEQEKEREKLGIKDEDPEQTPGDSAEVKAEPEEVKPEKVKTEKEEAEELFPEKPQEILNPRKPRNVSPSGTPAPTSDNAATESNAPASSTETSAPQPSPANGSMMPGGMNQMQQAQMLRQQQLRAQQQQQMYAMQQGMMGMPNPQMLQQQMFQLSAMLQNPALPPPMRMNLQGQLQQCQMMMMQYQQRIAMGMQQQQQQHLVRNGGGMNTQMGQGMAGGGGGQKRPREEGVTDEGSPVAKRSDIA
ncbi:cleavage polyadenylation factor subunit MPE1 [Sporobolomyces koalae]|uniref:cleavage polyadenylation factor subunit MPE1 n=1 Tax=Sporobolomyces koalae TaxID=500713 RepID=UPI00318281A6